MPNLDVEASKHESLASTTLPIKKLDAKLMPTDIFHAVLDDRSSPNISIYDRVLALYKQHGYSILEEKIEGIDLRAVNSGGNSHAVTICEEYILPHRTIDNIIANGASQSFIIITTQRDRSLIKINRDRIARTLWHRYKDGHNIWLIFYGARSSLERTGTIFPPSKDLATFQLMLTLVAIKKTLVEEGKISAERALDDLQDDLRNDLSRFTRE